jgi:hypothetical protein
VVVGDTNNLLFWRLVSLMQLNLIDYYSDWE